MNIESSFHVSNALGVPLPRELLVVFGTHSAATQMLDLTARLSLNGPLYLLDCGNRSNMYRVAKTLRTLTSDPVAILQNIRLSRAFTCYQVVALLEKLVHEEAGAPVLVLDLLATFMDESIKLDESSFLFDVAMQHLRRISRDAPVVASAKPLLTISSPRAGLLKQLKSQAFQVWEENTLPSSRSSNMQLPLLVDF